MDELMVLINRENARSDTRMLQSILLLVCVRKCHYKPIDQAGRTCSDREPKNDTRTQIFWTFRI
jgi:hypothetical protein